MLAIGDGANDVSMIQAAHVGIGISGVEVNTYSKRVNGGWHLAVGFTSCSVCRRCYLAVQVLEEVAARTRCLELPPFIKANFVYVFIFLARYQLHWFLVQIRFIRTSRCTWHSSGWVIALVIVFYPRTHISLGRVLVFVLQQFFRSDCLRVMDADLFQRGVYCPTTARHWYLWPICVCAVPWPISPTLHSRTEKWIFHENCLLAVGRECPVS